jgi:hypothetical protein
MPKNFPYDIMRRYFCASEWRHAWRLFYLLRANPYFQPLKVWQYALFCVEMLPPVIVKAGPKAGVRLFLAAYLVFFFVYLFFELTTGKMGIH